jgi:hypothetical protein
MPTIGNAITLLPICADALDVLYVLVEPANNLENIFVDVDGTAVVDTGAPAGTPKPDLNAVNLFCIIFHVFAILLN